MSSAAGEKRTNPRRFLWWYRFFFWAARNLVGRPVCRAVDFRREKTKLRFKTCLIVANHNDNFDPGYEVTHLKRYIRFVAGDHVTRAPGLGFWYRFCGGVIEKRRGQSTDILMDEIEANLRAGITVGLHAEGTKSVNGETGFISPRTGQLVKDSGAPLVTYRFTGGYLRNPRWGKSPRKGPIFGQVVGQYDPETLAAMTVEEINELIHRDVYVNVFEAQRENPQTYTGEDLAEHLEIVLYMCPKCGKTQCLHSKADEFFCDCGSRVTMGIDGFFHGRDVVYDNIVDWDHWQREAWRKLLSEAPADRPVLSCGGQRVSTVAGHQTTLLGEDAAMTLYPDRLVLSWAGEERVFPLSEIRQMLAVSKMTLLVVTDSDYLEVKSTVPRSAIQYMAAWRYATGRPYL